MVQSNTGGSLSPRTALAAVIFDCDGTLVDSLPIVRDVLRQYLETLDLGVPLEQATGLFGSGRLGDSVMALEQLVGRPLPGNFIDQLLQRRDENVRRLLRPMAGAAECLEALRVPAAVASNAPLPQTLLSLDVTGLLRYVTPHVYSAHEVGCWKPDPGLFVHTARQLGVEPERCAVVEDSALGVRAGLAAGMTVFAVGEASDFAGATAATLAELPRLLDYPHAG